MLEWLVPIRCPDPENHRGHRYGTQSDEESAVNSDGSRKRPTVEEVPDVPMTPSVASPVLTQRTIPPPVTLAHTANVDPYTEWTNSCRTGSNYRTCTTSPSVILCHRWSDRSQQWEHWWHHICPSNLAYLLVRVAYTVHHHHVAPFL